MQTSDLNQVYQTATALIEANNYKALEYVPINQLAMWCVRCIEQYHQRKVITERIYGHQDISIILSDYKLSVILNESGKHSWVKAENIIQYEDTAADIDTLMQCLDFAILRATIV